MLSVILVSSPDSNTYSLWPWKCYLVTLNLSFLICEITVLGNQSASRCLHPTLFHLYTYYMWTYFVPKFTTTSPTYHPISLKIHIWLFSSKLPIRNAGKLVLWHWQWLWNQKLKRWYKFKEVRNIITVWMEPALFCWLAVTLTGAYGPIEKV